jgi:Arc/MetJ-type ribon-helix-helix transcriptional regulator
MTITLTAEQEQFIHHQLATGQYQSSDEIVQIAFQLFAEQSQMNDPAWRAEVGAKIDTADASIARGECIPFDDAMNQIFNRFKQAKINS